MKVLTALLSTPIYRQMQQLLGISLIWNKYFKLKNSKING